MKTIALAPLLPLAVVHTQVSRRALRKHKVILLVLDRDGSWAARHPAVGHPIVVSPQHQATIVGEHQHQLLEVIFDLAPLGIKGGSKGP
ncbi:MAG TPA: hypothetical protein VEC99_13235, partial [Clostridia bacterium]|nr:hypothetical protein [Clostridia bacterium]